MVISRKQYVNLEKEIANVSKLYACNNSTWYFNVVLFKNLIHVFPVDQCVIEVSRENKCNVPSIFKVNNRDSRVMTLMPFWCLYFYISNFEHKNKNIISPYMETRMELLCFIIKIFFINFLQIQHLRQLFCNKTFPVLQKHYLRRESSLSIYLSNFCFLFFLWCDDATIYIQLYSTTKIILEIFRLFQNFSNVLKRSYPTAGIHLVKFNNKNTKRRCEICSKLTTKTPKRRHCSRPGVFIVNFEHISHFALVCSLLTQNT